MRDELVRPTLKKEKRKKKEKKEKREKKKDGSVRYYSNRKLLLYRVPIVTCRIVA